MLFQVPFFYIFTIQLFPNSFQLTTFLFINPVPAFLSHHISGSPLGKLMVSRVPILSRHLRNMIYVVCSLLFKVTHPLVLETLPPLSPCDSLPFLLIGVLELLCSFWSLNSGCLVIRFYAPFSVTCPGCPQLIVI